MFWGRSIDKVMAGEYDEKFEQLTRLIRETAERTDARFDELTTRADRSDGRFDDLATRADRADARFEDFAVRTDARFDDLATRADRADARFEDFAVRTDARFDDFSGRLESIESVTKKVSGRLDELILDVRDLRQEVGGLRFSVAENSEKLDAFRQEFTTVLVKESKRINSLEVRVDALEGQTH